MKGVVPIAAGGPNQVTGIKFSGGGASDTFRNQTGLPAYGQGRRLDDTLVGGTGPDRYQGDEGNDTFNLRDGRRGDVAVGGPGRDTAIVDKGDRTTGVEGVVKR